MCLTLTQKSETRQPHCLRPIKVAERSLTDRVQQSQKVRTAGIKTIDLSDFCWEKQSGTYDDDDRLHTHLGSADVIVDFSAERIGLKVHEHIGDRCYCCPLDKIPLDILGDWRPDQTSRKTSYSFRRKPR